MRYGIGIRYLVSPAGYGVNLAGVPCAVHASWGLPKLFDSYAEASQYALSRYGKPHKGSAILWEVIPERQARFRVGLMVEVTNGRRTIHPCTGKDGQDQWLIDGSKLTYEQMLPMLTKLAEQSQRDKLRRENYKLKHKPFVYGAADFSFPDIADTFPDQFPEENNSDGQET